LNPTADSWSDPLTWFNEQAPDELNSLFETMLLRWSDEGWQKAAQLAVYWYVLAQQNAASSDTALVLAFTGLDLVGWFRLVEFDAKYSASALDNANAAERLRRLLDHTGISATLPPKLPKLTAHAAAMGWSDGPAALAALRNATVHPRRRERVFDSPDEVRWEALKLALWYFELSILALLGHQGTYINRIEHKTSHGLEYVPWRR
jgi:hypothetical protein